MDIVDNPITENYFSIMENYNRNNTQLLIKRLELLWSYLGKFIEKHSNDNNVGFIFDNLLLMLENSIIEV